MRLHAKIGLKTFAVIIRKKELAERDRSLNSRDVAWDYLLQRPRHENNLVPQTLRRSSSLGHNPSRPPSSSQILVPALSPPE
jgi:hypothetical protein